MIDTKELRKLAQAATPGPWYVGTGTYECRNIYSAAAFTDDEGFTYQPLVANAEDDGINCWDANAHLIAAANPAAITELLDRLEASESECLEQARLNGMGAEREAALLAKLEAAEKSDAESLAMYRKARDERDRYKDLHNEWIDKTEWVQRGINAGTIPPKYCGWHRADVIADLLRTAEQERDELRAKIAGLVPIGLLHVGSYYGEELQDWEFEADQQACDRLNETHFQKECSLNLYALPCAKGEAK